MQAFTRRLQYIIKKGRPLQKHSSAVILRFRAKIIIMRKKCAWALKTSGRMQKHSSAVIFARTRKPARICGREWCKTKSACAVLWKSINPLLAGGCAEAEIIRTFRKNTDLAYFRERFAPWIYLWITNFPYHAHSRLLIYYTIQKTKMQHFIKVL